MNCINKVIFYADYTDESNDFKMPLTDTDVGWYFYVDDDDDQGLF